MKNMNGRVAALEEVFQTGREDESPEWLLKAADQAEEVLTRLEALGFSDEVFGQVVSLLQDNLDSLAWDASIGCTLKTLCVGDGLRRPRTLEYFLRMTPPDLRAAVVGALQPKEDRTTNRIDRWLRTMTCGESRLPADLPSDVMRQLLRIFLEEAEAIDHYFPVCESCGLLRPGRRWPSLSERTAGHVIPPAFFDGCPACGSREMMWANRIKERHYSWMDLDDYISGGLA